MHRFQWYNLVLYLRNYKVHNEATVHVDNVYDRINFRKSGCLTVCFSSLFCLKGVLILIIILLLELYNCTGSLNRKENGFVKMVRLGAFVTGRGHHHVRCLVVPTLTENKVSCVLFSDLRRKGTQGFLPIRILT